MVNTNKFGFKEPVMIAADSVRNSDMLYVSGFLAGDMFIYVFDGDEEYLLLSTMESGRAKKESRVRNVLTLDDFGYMDYVKKGGDGDKAYMHAVVGMLKSLKLKKVSVPQDFPLFVAEALRGEGIEVVMAERMLNDAREIKTQEEIEKIRESQRACEKAVSKAIRIIKKSEPQGEYLYYRGKQLTSELLRQEIEIELLKSGCAADGSIIAAGPRAADPHYMGEGPIRPGEPIILDIFPRNKATRYFADMTRTVVKGKASPELKKMYDAVFEAQKAGLEAIKAGVTGKEVHEKVCERLEKHGYGNLKKPMKAMMNHSTGHGLGLDVHESPRLSDSGLKPLKAGMVVTVEPGVYDPDIGGIRIEDLVVVTESGCENLTKMPKYLEV